MTFVEIITFMKKRRQQNDANDLQATEDQHSLSVHSANGSSRSNVLGDVQVVEVPHQVVNQD